MTGRLRLKVRPGDPATQADEADIQLTMSVTDVRCGPQQIPFVCSDATTETTLWWKRCEFRLAPGAPVGIVSRTVFNLP